jgi:hypothetical protein
MPISFENRPLCKISRLKDSSLLQKHFEENERERLLKKIFKPKKEIQMVKLYEER